MQLLSEHRPRTGWRVIRTATMADDEYTYAYWEAGAFWEYGEGYGLRLRREVTDVVAWRNLTYEDRCWMRQQRIEHTKRTLAK